MTLAGAWGQPRNRYTRTVQPGQAGGMNSRGSVQQAAQPYQGGAQMRSARSAPIKYGDPSVFNRYPANEPDPSAFNRTPNVVQGKDPSAFSGNKTPSFNAGASTGAGGKSGGLKFPSYIDARYQRNMADLMATLEQQKATSKRELQNMRGSFRTGSQGLDEERGIGYDQLYAGLGGGNVGRSGYVTSGGEQVQQGYQRGMDDLLRQFGPKQQKLTKDLMAIASKQFQSNMGAEGQMALDRKIAYEMAGQAPPSFTPSSSFTLPDGTKPEKPKKPNKPKKNSGVNKL